MCYYEDALHEAGMRGRFFLHEIAFLGRARVQCLRALTSSPTWITPGKAFPQRTAGAGFLMKDQEYRNARIRE